MAAAAKAQRKADIIQYVPCNVQDEEEERQGGRLAGLPERSRGALGQTPLNYATTEGYRAKERLYFSAGKNTKSRMSPVFLLSTTH